MSFMRYYIYALRRLTDPENVFSSAERWAKRRRKTVSSITVDHSTRQRRRARLLTGMKPGDVLIVPSLQNLCADVTDAIKLFQTVRDRGIIIVIVNERLKLRPGSVRVKLLIDFCRQLHALSLGVRREARVRAEYITRLLGTKVGRDPLPIQKRHEVIRLVRQDGFSLAEAAKQVGISKSSAHRFVKSK